MTFFTHQIESSLKNFSFGTIPTKGHFVYHFDSWSTFEFESSLIIDRKNVIFQNDQKRIIIRFEITSNETTALFHDRNLNETEIKEIWLNNVGDCLSHLFDLSDFDFNLSTQTKCFELIIDYANIQYALIEDNLNYCNLYLVEKFPGLLFEIINLNDTQTYEDEVIDDMMSNFRGFRLRTTQFPGLKRPQHLTKSNVIKLNFIKSNGFKTANSDKIISLIEVVQMMNLFEPTIGYNLVERFKCYSSIKYYKIPNDLPFKIHYSLESLVEYSFTFNDSFTDSYLNLYSTQQYIGFNNLINNYLEENIDALELSLQKMFELIETGQFIEPIKTLEKLFSEFNQQNQNEVWKSRNTIEVRRVVLTPTRMILLPALPLQQSRFLRNHDPEYCIRLLIKDENFQSVTNTACKHTCYEDKENLVKGFLHQFIYHQLIDGLRIGQRIYRVIGASTSQLRDHGLVLYAQDKQGRNLDSMRKFRGNLEEIQNPAKFIARIGQLMSQSIGYLPNVSNYQVINDILDGEKLNIKTRMPTGEKFIFSDGVGIISKSLAKKLISVVSEQDMNDDNFDDNLVSTYQVRYGGAKGILVLNPDLKFDEIQLRPSMIKFQSDSTDLDLLKYSEPRNLYLNRPMITILDEKKVPGNVILQLQFKHLKELATGFMCTCKALDLIKYHSHYKLHFRKISNSNINILKEPFFCKIIESIFEKSIQDLKNKSRILVPNNKGRIMYGVLDETITLNYGQVFVQFTDIETGKRIVVTGDVLVTKFPCMHPGDIRKFKAIDVPNLHHICDSIAFPAKGSRPHPDEMAGSDLDGDEYSVIWYQPLIFPSENSEPMIFPNYPPVSIGKSVEVSDILNFYQDFIMNNQVGPIANAYLTFADNLNEGIDSPKCKRLAYKYAVALDYAKTQVNQRLKRDEKPTYYPDFMMKENQKPTYKSTRILGKLFRNCSHFYSSYCIGQKGTYYGKNNETYFNPFFQHPNWEKYKQNAIDMFNFYVKTIEKLMKQFGIENETALLSGCYLKTHKYLCAKNESNDIQDLLTKLIDNLMNDLREKFELEFKDKLSSKVLKQEKLAKASALYMVSYENNKINSNKYYGLPWIVSNYLIDLTESMSNSKGIKHDCFYQGAEMFEDLFEQNQLGSKVGDKISIQNEQEYRTTFDEIISIFQNNTLQHPLLDGVSLKERDKIEKLIDLCVDQSINEWKKAENYLPSYGYMFLTFLFNIINEIENEHEEALITFGIIILVSLYQFIKSGQPAYLFGNFKTDDIEDIQNLIEGNENVTATSLVINCDLRNQIFYHEQAFFQRVKLDYGIQNLSVRYNFSFKFNDSSRESQFSIISAVGTKESIQKLTNTIFEFHRFSRNQIEEQFFEKFLS